MTGIGLGHAVHARWQSHHYVRPHVKSLALRALRMPGMSALSRYNDASNNQKSSFFSAVRGMVSMLFDHCYDVSSNAVVAHRLNPYLHVAIRHRQAVRGAAVQHRTILRSFPGCNTGGNTNRFPSRLPVTVSSPAARYEPRAISIRPVWILVASARKPSRQYPSARCHRS